MNVKTLIISALAMATGASFGGAAYESLALQTNNFFSATVGASDITLASAEWSLPAGYTWAYETVGGMTCAEINTELTAPVTLQSSTLNSSNPIKMMAFDLIASTVPVGTEIDAPSGKTPAYGFAIRAVQGTGDNANRQFTNFYAKVGSPLAWVKLSGDVPTENTAYRLTVIEDARTGFGQVQFRVKINDTETILADATNTSTTWFSVNSRTNLQQVNIDLYGTGYFHMIDGDDVAVVSATVDDGTGKKVNIKSEDSAAIVADAGGEAEVPTYLETKFSTQYAGATGAADITVKDAYALGLIKKNSGGTAMEVVGNGSIVMSKKAQTSEVHSESIPLALNITPPPDAANVTFTLLGSNDGSSSSWNAVQSDAAASALAIPLTGTVYKYYKVQANITYAK